MLKGVPSSISPELLMILHQMGHGDRLLLADAHFPGHSVGQRVVRADGLLIAPLLADILQLLQLDEPQNPLAMMEVDPGSTADPHIEADYSHAVQSHQELHQAPLRLGRAEFYKAAQSCFAIVMTGDTRPYGNLLITKGVTPTRPRN